MEHLPAVMGTLIPIAVFVMVVFIVWFGEQRKGKEALYRNELLRKVAEAQGDAAHRVLDMIREQEYEAKVRRYEGIKLGGLITAAVGLGLMAVLALLEREEPAWIVGVIPLMVGVALFAYILFLSPKPNRTGSN